MAELNVITCVQSGAGASNTGVGSCTFDPKEIIGALLVPKGLSLSNSEVVDLKETLISLANEDDRSKRVFPIGTFVELEDGSEDEQTEEFGYGVSKVTREGTYILSFRFTNGGKCLHSKLRAFNGAEDSYDVIFVDRQQALLGTMVEKDGEPALGGYALEELYVPKMTFSDGSASTGYWIRFTLADVAEVNDRFGFVLPAPQDVFNVIRTVRGMIDIVLRAGTTSLSTGEVTVTALANCGSTNIAELFGQELNDTSLWIVTAPLGVVAITSVSVIDGKFELVLDTSDSNYPSANDVISIKLDEPSSLETAGLVSPEGSLFESNVTRSKVE